MSLSVTSNEEHLTGLEEEGSLLVVTADHTTAPQQQQQQQESKSDSNTPTTPHPTTLAAISPTSAISDAESHLHATLSTAFQQAQTRARQLEERIDSVYEHIDRELKSAVSEVHRAKRAVRRLRVNTTDGLNMDPLQRSASDSTALNAQLKSHPSQPSTHTSETAGYTTSSMSSPHPYLAALASPTSGSPLTTSHTPSLSHTATGSPVQSAIGMGNIASSPSMPSLRLGPTAAAQTTLLAELEVPTQESKEASPSGINDKAGSSMDESYCLLPYQSTVSVDSSNSASSGGGAVPTTMQRSSSHHAMMEATEAFADLSREPAPNSPVHQISSTSSSLQSSPVPTDAVTPPYPLSSTVLPELKTSISNNSLNLSGSPLSSTRSQVMATSSYSITPSISSPPIHPRRKASVGSSSGLGKVTTVSPLLRPQSPGTQAQPPTSESGQASSASSSVVSMPSSSPALSSALRKLKRSQQRFETLAQFCAPIILRSQSYLRLKEEAALERLGVLESMKHGETMSDEELSASIELQARGHARSPEDEEHIESETEERKSESKDVDSSLVIVESHATKEQESAAMQLYIKQLRSQLLLEEKESTSSSTSTLSSTVEEEKKSNDASPISLDTVVEGCVLLHHELVVSHDKVDELQLKLHEAIQANKELKRTLEQQTQAHSSELNQVRGHCSELNQRNTNMAEILSQLNIPIDEKGRCPDGFELNQNQGSSIWKYLSFTLALGSVLVVSAVNWRRILIYLHDRFPRALANIGVTDEFIRNVAEGCGKATTEAATQTAAAAATTAAAQATADFMMNGGHSPMSSASPSPITPTTSSYSAPATYTEHTYGPLMFTHHVVHTNDSTVHFIDLHRFPRFLDFISRISLQFVAAVA